MGAYRHAEYEDLFTKMMFGTENRTENNNQLLCVRACQGYFKTPILSIPRFCGACLLAGIPKRRISHTYY